MRVAVTIALTLLLQALPARAEEPVDPAAALYQEGADRASQGDWSAAREKFEAAVLLRATPVGLFNLAQAERNLGLLASAKRHFASARSLATREGADDVLRLADDALAALAGKVPRVTLHLPRDAARVEVLVDGRPAEVFEGEIEVDPGSRELVVNAAGEKPFRRRVELQEGTRFRLDVKFERPEPPRRTPAPRAAQSPAAVQSTRSGGVPTGAFILGGVGLASLGTALAFHLERNEKLDEAAAGCTRSGDAWECPRSLERDPTHRALKDDAARAELWRNIGLGVGLSALTAGGVWLALGSGAEKRRAEVAIQADRRGPTARLRWTF